MSKTVGITGASGQLGYFCQLRFEHYHKFDVRALDRIGFGDSDRLAEFVKSCDTIVHCAGVNRGTEDEVSQGNPALANALVDACRQNNVRPDIVYTSSIQVGNGTVYGASKHAAGATLEAFCRDGGCKYTEVVLPNLFGEFSKPFYNNFTGTFCRQIADGQTPTVHQDTAVELLHYCDAADAIADAVKAESTGQVCPRGEKTSVGAVARKLAEFAESYGQGTIPSISDPFDLRLFNSYRQVLYPSTFPRKLQRHADQRGSFIECVRETSGGQTSFSTTVPGITRGNHFHFFKVERFVVLSGSARISIRRMLTDEFQNFDVNSDEPVFIDMPTLHTHNITNTGSKELLTLFWVNEHFDPANPDTFMAAVTGSN
jgi:UDP-2-acetamido-2,6-beta-L-arabino-hexul-4-ose reductase